MFLVYASRSGRQQNYRAGYHWFDDYLLEQILVLSRWQSRQHATRVE